MAFASCSAMLNDITGSFAGRHSGRRHLLEERDVAVAVERAEDDLRVGQLDLVDYRAEIGAAERNVFFAGDNALASCTMCFLRIRFAVRGNT